MRTVWYNYLIDPNFVEFSRIELTFDRILKWMLVLSGMGMMAYAGFLNYQDNSAFPVKKLSEDSNGKDEKDIQSTDTNVSQLDVRAAPLTFAPSVD